LPRAKVRPASVLGTRGSQGPKRLARRYRTHVAESGCQLRGRRPGTIGKTGRATRVSPRDPVEDSRSLTRAPPDDGLLAETAAGCSTRRSRACNPLVKDQHPGFASAAGNGENRGRRVSRFTALHPLSPAGCAPVRRSLPVWRAPSECLALLSPEVLTALRRRRSHGAPRRDAQTRRVIGGREQHERGAPSADDEHPEAPARASLREPQCRSPGAE
jgi:hypothetical protein